MFVSKLTLECLTLEEVKNGGGQINDQADGEVLPFAPEDDKIIADDYQLSLRSNGGKWLSINYYSIFYTLVLPQSFHYFFLTTFLHKFESTFLIVFSINS